MPVYQQAHTMLIFIIFCLYVPSRAFAQDNDHKKEHVKDWTNEDLKYLSSSVGNITAPPAEDQLEEAVAKKHYVRAKDPKWYVGQLQPLRQQVGHIDQQLQSFRQVFNGGRGGTATVHLDQEEEGVTATAQVEILEQRRKRILQSIDDLEEQARRNGMEPGTLRSEISTTDGTPERTVTTGSGFKPSDAADNDTEAAETENSIKRAQEHLRRARKEADLLQRTLQLKRRQVYSNPEYLSHHDGDAHLASLENEIRTKNQEIQLTEQEIIDLEDHLKELGLNPAVKGGAVNHVSEYDSNSALVPHQESAEEHWRKEFSELRYKMRTAVTELDILQREWNVELLQYDPNPAVTMRESVTRKRIDGLRKAIDEKKLEIQQLRQQLSDSEDDLCHAGGEPGWARE